MSHAADALAHARALQLDAASVGFDWPDVSGALAKLREEVDEFGDAIARGPVDAQEAELGDVLFSAVNVSRFIGVDASEALRRTSRKFESRFRRVKSVVQGTGRAVDECSLDELDAVWEAVKREEEHDGGITAP